MWHTLPGRSRSFSTSSRPEGPRSPVLTLLCPPNLAVLGSKDVLLSRLQDLTAAPEQAAVNDNEFEQPAQRTKKLRRKRAHDDDNDDDDQLQRALAASQEDEKRDQEEREREEDEFNAALLQSAAHEKTRDQERQNLKENLERLSLKLADVRRDGDCQYQAMREVWHMIQPQGTSTSTTPAVPEMRSQASAWLHDHRARSINTIPAVSQVFAGTQNCDETLQDFWGHNRSKLEHSKYHSFDDYLEGIKASEFGDEFTLAAICSKYSLTMRVVSGGSVTTDTMIIGARQVPQATIGHLPSEKHWVATSTENELSAASL